MLFFLKLNNRIFCKMLAVTSVLFLAFAVVTPVLHAQDWDQINGRDKVHDPTGAWLITAVLQQIPAGEQQFGLITFHKGGTVTQDFQGESAFDPAAVNPPQSPNNVQTSPQHGVWQKTGWKTFAATLVAIEAGVDVTKGLSTLFRFDKAQYTGKLSESGDQIDLTLVFSAYDINGNQIVGPAPALNFKGVRVPLEILPHTGTTLPVPVISPTPAAP
jgi:hypothetical protein